MQRNRRFQIFSLVLVSGLFLALLAHAYVGLFTRYWYDDFCTAASLREKGFIGFQRFWYVTWSGRFSYHLLVSLTELIGPSVVPFLPAFALTGWAVAATWTIYQLFLIISFPNPFLSSLVTALTLVFATIHSTPDVVQSLYWQTGMLTYLAPLILLTIYLGAFVFAVPKKPSGRALVCWSILSALVTFLAGGLSETYSVLQVAVLGVSLIASSICFPKPFRRVAISMTMGGLLGAVLALTIVALAPGNKNRLAAFPAPPTSALFKSTISYTLYFIERCTRRSRATALLSLLLPCWLVLSPRLFSDKNSQAVSAANLILGTAAKLIALSFIVTCFLIGVCFLPVYLVSREGLPGRGQVIPTFVLIVFMMFSGFLLSLAFQVYFRRSPKPLFLTVISAIVFILATWVPFRAALQTFALGRTARMYAAKWDALEHQIRVDARNGQTELVVPVINANNWGLGCGRIGMLPGPDPAEGANRCLASYYGIKSVRTE